MQRIFPALVLMLVLSACGSREVLVGGNGEPRPVATTASAAPTTLSAFPAPSTVDEAIGQVRGTGGGEARLAKQGTGKQVDYGTMGPDKSNTMPLTVRLNATCATPGQTMQATAETLPGSRLAFAAGYSDNDFVPNFTYVPAEANPTGTFTWSWEITPSTPRGNAVVMVVAGKDDRGASYKAPFRVADSC